jgi:hypothetical protein
MIRSTESVKLVSDSELPDRVSLNLTNIFINNFMITDMVGAKVGLALSQALIVTGMLQHGLLRATEVVSQMTAVERVLDYTNIEKEPDLNSAPGKIRQEEDSFLPQIRLKFKEEICEMPHLEHSIYCNRTQLLLLLLLFAFLLLLASQPYCGF